MLIKEKFSIALRELRALRQTTGNEKTFDELSEAEI
jgi:hypothetical protein